VLGSVTGRRSWNEFSHFLVVTQRPELNTMVTGLASLTSGELWPGTQFPLKMGAALLTTIRVALLFFAFHRHFVRGANTGAAKADRPPPSAMGADSPGHQPGAEDRHDRPDDGPERHARHHAAAQHVQPLKGPDQAHQDKQSAKANSHVLVHGSDATVLRALTGQGHLRVGGLIVAMS
jgi:hypothetical protein